MGKEKRRGESASLKASNRGAVTPQQETRPLPGPSPQRVRVEEQRQRVGQIVDRPELQKFGGNYAALKKAIDRLEAQGKRRRDDVKSS